MISIIVTIYNVEKYLDQCIQSILKQTYQDFELLLIDDGSTDNSQRIANKYVSQDQRVKYFYQPNQGVSIARNYGLSLASGEYVCFFDSDDYIEEMMLEIMYQQIINTNNCQLVVCGINEHLKNGKNHLVLPEYSGYILVSELAIKYPHLLKTSLINSCANKIYKRKLINHLQSQQQFIGEDLLFNLDYIKNIDGIYFLNQPLYNYIIHDNSLNHSYHHDVFEQMTNLYCAKMQFCQDLKFSEIAKKDVATTYMTFVIYGITSMYKFSNLTRGQCFKNLVAILNNNYVKEALLLAKPEKKYHYLLYPLFKFKRAKILDLLFYKRANRKFK